MSAGSKREQIVEAADDLFYRQGFEHTSFAHIAAAVNMSRGNFYYHFKTKDEILDAVIDRRLANTREMLDNWEIEGQGPAARIRCFIGILIMNRARIKNFGCPVGSLTNELNKLEHPARGAASRIFSLFRGWLKEQFVALGHAACADDLAMQLLARSQGVATLASAFNDEKFIREEVTQMNLWLDGYTGDNSKEGE